MTLYTLLDRTAIKTALSAYLNAEQQRVAVLDDRQIQMLFSKDQNEEARKLIDLRYPEARKVKVRAIELIKVMTQNIEEWKGVDPEDVYYSVVQFNKLVELAKQI
jgi:hypothetical protein